MSFGDIKVHTIYQPAKKFGGDWLSLTYHSKEKHAIILVGDVTGHGNGSGLMAVTVGATIHGAISMMDQLSENLSFEAKLNFLAKGAVVARGGLLGVAQEAQTSVVNVPF